MAFRHGSVSRYSEELHSAVRANDVVTLKQLLSKGADPNMCYGDRYSCVCKSILHIACGLGYTNCVRILLEAGAMPDIHDKWGEMPLHYCLCCEFYDTATVLLEHAGHRAPAIVNSKQGCQFRTSVFMVAMLGSIEGLKVLLHFGANLNDVDCKGMTPLMAMLKSTHCVEQLMLAMRMLVESGADVNVRDQEGVTALQLAALRMDPKAIEYLVSAGADVNTADCHGRTALIKAMKTSVVKGLNPDAMSIMETLTRAGADLSSPYQGSNVLLASLSLQKGSETLLRFFLNQGANPDVFVWGETTPLVMAIQQGNAKGALILLQHNCSLLKITGRLCFPDGQNLPCVIDPLEMAVRMCRMDLVRLLLLAGDESWRSDIKCAQILNVAMDEHEQGRLDAENLQWFQQYLTSPPRLLELTAYKLRSLFGRQLFGVVPQLPLPSKVRAGIFLTHLFD